MRTVIRTAGIIAALLIIAVLCVVWLFATPPADAAGMMGVGTMMQGKSAPGGSQSGHGLNTESNSLITTESGIGLRTE